MPHDATVNFRPGNTLAMIKMICNCAAGASECCKYVVSIVLYLNR